MLNFKFSRATSRHLEPRADPTRADPTRADPTRADPTRADPDRTELEPTLKDVFLSKKRSDQTNRAGTTTSPRNLLSEHRADRRKLSGSACPLRTLRLPLREKASPLYYTTVVSS